VKISELCCVQIGYEQLCTRWNREEAEAWKSIVESKCCMKFE